MECLDELLDALVNQALLRAEARAAGLAEHVGAVAPAGLPVAAARVAAQRGLTAQRGPAVQRGSTAQRGPAVQLVTGMHGTGKAAELELRAAEALAAGVAPERLAVVDLADARLLAAVRDAGLLERVVERRLSRTPAVQGARATGAVAQGVRPGCLPTVQDDLLHLFVNRIDLLEGWEAALARLLAVRNLRVVATGECASWLSGVPGAALPPEALLVSERLPANLVAFARSSGVRGRPSLALSAYLEHGGLETAPGLGDAGACSVRLQALVRDAIALAAVADARLAQVPLACATAQLALASAGRRFSVTSAVRDLTARGFATTRATVAQQLAALCDLHLVHAVQDFGAALKENPRAAATLYAGDHALPAVFGAAACGAPAITGAPTVAGASAIAGVPPIPGLPAAGFSAVGAPVAAPDPAAPGILVAAKNAVYLHLRRTDLFGGVYTYRVAPGAAGTVDFAVGNPCSGTVHALFHVVGQPRGRAFKQAVDLLDRALGKTGLHTAVLIHLGGRHAARAVTNGTVRFVPLGDWLLSE